MFLIHVELVTCLRLVKCYFRGRCFFGRACFYYTITMKRAEAISTPCSQRSRRCRPSGLCPLCRAWPLMSATSRRRRNCSPLSQEWHRQRQWWGHFHQQWRMWCFPEDNAVVRILPRRVLPQGNKYVWNLIRVARASRVLSRQEASAWTGMELQTQGKSDWRWVKLKVIIQSGREDRHPRSPVWHHLVAGNIGTRSYPNDLQYACLELEQSETCWTVNLCMSLIVRQLRKKC